MYLKSTKWNIDLMSVKSRKTCIYIFKKKEVCACKCAGMIFLFLSVTAHSSS